MKKSAPGGGVVLSGRLTRRVKSHRGAQSGRWKQMFTLFGFRSERKKNVIITRTSFNFQNCSISVLVDPGNAKKKFENLARPRYNYAMQSSRSMVTTRMQSVSIVVRHYHSHVTEAGPNFDSQGSETAPASQIILAIVCPPAPAARVLMPTGLL